MGAEKKKRISSDKKYVKKLLSVYFAVSLSISAILCLMAGLDNAERGTRKVWFGEEENVITLEDIKKEIEEKIETFLLLLFK